ncbi:uncharacterized protein LOC124337207 [Daphnia pulicaria]|uniref:uncharacterized protein LOC124337207 n=1 Tax=Daphnia pulicaria TaxID=35523 RepID=UPI001EEB6580|nr:uncharacterized protein LOC124337207 [Daphnia pulicaria]
MCGVMRFSHYCYHTNHFTSNVLLNHRPHDKASGNLSQPRSNAVGCCNSIITVFHRQHFSVLLRKEPVRSPQTSLSQCWILSMKEEGLPTMFCSILIFKTHPASVFLMLLVLLHNFSCFTGELDHFSCCDTPEVTPHGIMAR